MSDRETPRSAAPAERASASAGWRQVETARGPGRLQVLEPDRDRASERGGLGVLLSHGAGTGTETVDLLALAAALPAEGFRVALFEQPWRTAGRSVATAPPTLDEGLQAAAGFWAHPGPLVVGGRSAGARSAARCAAGLGAVGCLCLSFPLHPPGRPESSRASELNGVGLPALVVQGERDPMGRPDEFPAGTDLVVVPGGDHSLRVPKRGPITQEQAMADVVDRVVAWLAGLASVPHI